MIKDWVNVTRIALHDCERLYPGDLDWKLHPGINAIVGGTSLGKTTLVYALQFAIFEKILVDGGERIERDFFRDRLSTRSVQSMQKQPPRVEVHFSVAGSNFFVNRSLLTGAQISAACDGKSLTGSAYRETLAAKIGVPGDFDSLGKLQGHLLFLGESRYLLAWDNLLQNDILNLLLSDHDTYERLNKLWRETESADSEARNLSSQAARLEKDIEQLSTTDNVKELSRRSKLNELTLQRNTLEEEISAIQIALRNEEKALVTQNEEVAELQVAFQLQLAKLEEDLSEDIDPQMLQVATENPTSESVRYALEQFYSAPEDRLCPCCGRPGIPQAALGFVSSALAAARDSHCIICTKELTPAKRKEGPSRPSAIGKTDTTAARLQAALFRREQVLSRLESLKGEEDRATRRLSAIRDEELRFRQDNPASTLEPLQAAVSTMRSRQKLAERRRSARLRELNQQLEATNKTFAGLQSGIAKAFKQYASLYLDEPCDVELLKDDSLPGRRGPQVKAPHAAFYPIVSGQTRPSAQALSDAQRTFVDLALRMAIIDVWHRKTGKTVTLIVETPEGATDLAYMERVATMLGTFSKQGHTLLVTSNLNNAFFLPELMAIHPKAERSGRMLNLLEKGRPHDVQKRHRIHFNQILKQVASRRVVS